MLRLRQILHKHVKVIDADCVHIVAGAEHGRHVLRNLPHHIYRAASPGSIGCVKFQTRAIDLLPIVQELSEGVGRVVKQSRAEDSVMVLHKRLPVRRIKEEKKGRILR